MKTKQSKNKDIPKIIYCLDASVPALNFKDEVFPVYIPSPQDIIESESKTRYLVKQVVHSSREGEYTILVNLHPF